LAHAETLFNDNPSPRLSPPTDDLPESVQAPAENEFEEEEMKESPAPQPVLSDPETIGRNRQPEKPVDTRNARQKAQDFLAAGDDAARRIKLLKDMFSGRLIDESGQPI
jgi:hypothetical protein